MSWWVAPIAIKSYFFSPKGNYFTSRSWLKNLEPILPPFPPLTVKISNSPTIIGLKIVILVSRDKLETNKNIFDVDLEFSKIWFKQNM